MPARSPVEKPARPSSREHAALFPGHRDSLPALNTPAIRRLSHRGPAALYGTVLGDRLMVGLQTLTLPV